MQEYFSEKVSEVNMLEIIKGIALFVKCWADVFLIAVGLVAVWVYHLQKSDTIKAAATELKDQISEIENALQTFVDDPKNLSNHKLYLLGEICTENLWIKNRTVLSRYLNEDDRESIRKFYVFAEKVERARVDTLKCLKDTWYHKSYLEQEILAKQYMSTDLIDDKFTQKLDDFLLDGNVFIPDMCLGILKTAKDFKPLIGTTTYKKLTDLSNKPTWLIF